MQKISGGYGVAVVGAIVLFGLAVISGGWLSIRWFQGAKLSSWSPAVAVCIMFAALVGGVVLLRSRYAITTPDRGSVILAIVVSLLCLIMSEYGLRLWLIYIASEDTYRVYATHRMIQSRPLRYTAHPYLPFIPTPNYTNSAGDHHNSLGFRGEEIVVPKPKDIFRIVTIGGSTTYTSEVATYKEAYPYVLEQELRARGFKNIEVVNAGVPFYDSWSILANLMFRVLPLDPDMVVYYEGDNEFKTRLVYPFESYRADNTGRVRSRDTREVTLIDRFVLTRMVFKPFGWVSDFGYLGTIYDAPTAVFDEYLSQVQDAKYPTGIFREHPVEEFFERNTDAYTRRNIENMAGLLRTHDIPFVIASYTYIPVGVRATTPVYQKFVVDFNMLLKDVAEKNKISFFDFASVMSKDEQYWIRDGVHLNAKGAALKGKLFADFLSPLIRRYQAYH